MLFQRRHGYRCASWSGAPKFEINNIQYANSSKLGTLLKQDCYRNVFFSHLHMNSWALILQLGKDWFDQNASHSRSICPSILLNRRDMRPIRTGSIWSCLTVWKHQLSKCEESSGCPIKTAGLQENQYGSKAHDLACGGACRSNWLLDLLLMFYCLHWFLPSVIGGGLASELL